MFAVSKPYLAKEAETNHPIGLNENNCEQCHAEIYYQWQNSKHASSQNNLWVTDLYYGTAGEGKGLPDSGPGYRRSYPNSYGDCAFCHVPDIALRTPYQAELNIDYKDDSLGQNNNRIEETSSEFRHSGIYCDICHAVTEVQYYTNSHMPGVLSYQFTKPRTTRDNMTVRTGENAYPLVSQSLFCAPCHTTKNFNVPIYDTYNEWEKSSYSKDKITCQHCHFRDNSGEITHELLGPNNRDFIKSAIEVNYDIRSVEDKLEVVVSVANIGAGHYFPTGSPLRNVILLVDVKEIGGNRLNLIGNSRLSEYTGKGSEYDDYFGFPGKLFAKVLKNNKISSCDPELKELGIIGQDFTDLEDMNLFAFWNPSHIESDTRIPPGSTDTSQFQFQIEPSQVNLSIEIKLIYTKIFKSLARRKLWTSDNKTIAEFYENVKID